MHRTLHILPLLVAAAAPVPEQAPPPREPAPAPVTYADVVNAAVADAKALPPGLATVTRYLSVHNLTADQRREGYSVTGYHVNSLSREVKITPPRKVNEYLWAVRLDDYRWDAKVWEDLARVNVYFTIKVQQADNVVRTETVKRQRQVLKYDQYGRGQYVTEEYDETVTKTVPGKPAEKFIPAPWLPAAAMTELVTLTGSATPIVRADQFYHQTSIQAGRKGHGYYDWLQLTKLADAEQLAGLDRQKAIDLYREYAAIVVASGVAPNNRQIFAFDTVGGQWWETKDVVKNTDANNAVDRLLDDFKFDATEVVFSLPNRLPGWVLADAKGALQDTAPDTIAADHRSTNNDRRVHAGQCVMCHTDSGLKPIRDYGRRVYNPKTGVSLATLALDAAKARRIESAYLGPLDRAYKRGTAEFGAAIEEAAGLKPQNVSKAAETFWSNYLDMPVTLAKVAAEAGYTADAVRTRLREHAKAKGVLDPVLAVLLIDDEEAVPLRREHAEDRWATVMLILGGANP